MFDECRFEPGIGMGKYFVDLPIRLVSNEEIIKNLAYNLVIILNIPNLKLEKSNQIRKISMRIQNLKFFLGFFSFILFIWIALNAILGNNSAHSFVNCPVIANPFISPLRFPLLQYYPRNPSAFISSILNCSLFYVFKLKNLILIYVWCQD